MHTLLIQGHACAMKIDIRSEIGELTAVILHAPGPEVENMTPDNAERALYSDILNLSVAENEYLPLADLLACVCHTYQVRDLLVGILGDPSVKKSLVTQICLAEGCLDLCDDLMTLPAATLADQLIEGVALPRDNLTRFLSKERFSLPPLHNFFFTRDAAMGIGGEMFIGRMAKPVRSRESMIMAAIFGQQPDTRVATVGTATGAPPDPAATVEGGDLIVAREDILIIGNGSRTSTQGIDGIIEHFKSRRGPLQHILVQELPHHPESFIHLDMVFTLLDHTTCMVFAPLMLEPNKYHTIHIRIDNGRVTGIQEASRLIDALRHLGMDLTPVCCGGTRDLWIQEREQWHSGANFFAIAPGQVIGYARNVHTMEAMSESGFAIVPAAEIISGRRNLADTGRCAITLEGSELPRGGGGARCMTLPVSRLAATP
jgi:arginine deiminase